MTSSIAESLRRRAEAYLTAVPEALDEAERIALADMRSRTLSGLKVSGKPFASYSEDYARRKGTTQVTITSTGDTIDGLAATRETDMRRAIRVAGAQAAMVGNIQQWGSKSKRGRQVNVRAHSREGRPVKGHKRLWKLPRRRWFGVSRDAQERITQVVVDKLKIAQERISGTLRRQITIRL